MATQCHITIPLEFCSVEICSVECQGIIRYQPSLPANYTFMGIFALILFFQVGLGVRYCTWGFLVGMFCGLVLEIVGYAGRVALHRNPFSLNLFVLYLIGLTIGPAFMSASIYLCLARIVKVYGVHLSRIQPRTYTVTFVSVDFLSLVLQAVGGAISAINIHHQAMRDIGVHIMVAGLAFQVFSLLAFMAICIELAWRVRRSFSGEKDSAHLRLRKSFKFKAFLCALAVATFTIFIRSVYHVAELQGGFDSVIANNETAFIILEGPMAILATVALTLFHPGDCFAGSWDNAGFSLRRG